MAEGVGRSGYAVYFRPACLIRPEIRALGGRSSAAARSRRGDVRRYDCNGNRPRRGKGHSFPLQGRFGRASCRHCPVRCLRAVGERLPFGGVRLFRLRRRQGFCGLQGRFATCSVRGVARRGGFGRRQVGRAEIALVCRQCFGCASRRTR